MSIRIPQSEIIAESIAYIDLAHTLDLFGKKFHIDTEHQGQLYVLIVDYISKKISFQDFSKQIIVMAQPEQRNVFIEQINNEILLPLREHMLNLEALYSENESDEVSQPETDPLQQSGIEIIADDKDTIQAIQSQKTGKALYEEKMSKIFKQMPTESIELLPKDSAINHTPLESKTYQGNDPYHEPIE